MNMIEGACHCGAVRWSLEGVPETATACNCTICRRKGYFLSFHSPEKFRLETPREAITVYTFNSHNIRHQFCKTCGCAVFGEGVGPDGKAMVAVNLRCAEDFDLEGVKTVAFDGASL